MEDVLYGDIGRRRRRRRVFHERVDVLNTLRDEELYEKYRFTRAGIEFLVELLTPLLRPITRRSNSISVTLQVLTSLYYLAGGSLQRIVGDSKDLRLSQSSVCRIIHKFCRALCTFKNRFVRFPTERRDILRHNGGFFRGGIPNICGLVDGTQVQVLRPILHEEAYVNRHNYHSLNVQVICDSDSKFTNVVAKWPGSVHDSTIMQMSNITTYFEQPGNHNKGLLLGDSGYRCQNWLLTPYRNANTIQQERFNRYFIIN